MNFTTLFSLVSLARAVPELVTPHLPDPVFNASRFEVHSLPDGPSLPRSWAGRLPVPGTAVGNSLFFWLFEAEDPVYDDNLISKNSAYRLIYKIMRSEMANDGFIVWFNGGPGCSSLIGMATANGPISFVGNTTLTSNPYSWTKLGHVLYIDQPVGTGFSTASEPYPVKDNARVTSDFYAWLGSFYKLFPQLLGKRTHMMGESYAGIYIPYFASKIMDNHDSLPVNLKSISLGDGTFGNNAAMSSVATGSYLRSQSSILGIPDDILDAFSEADAICGFDQVMEQANTFSPKGVIHIPGNPGNLNFKRDQSLLFRRDLEPILNGTCNIHPVTPEQVKSSILNSSCYGPCATFPTAMDYMQTAPAFGKGKACFDVYNIKHDCGTIDADPLLASYFSRADVQAALNILPSSSSKRSSNKTRPFTPCNSNILSTLLTSPTQPVPPAYSILPTLTSTTGANLSLHFYQGEYDMLINHFGVELCLQNMTWNGARGFSQKPSRAFFRDDAAPVSKTRPVRPRQEEEEDTRSYDADTADEPQVAGTWISERGLTYHLFRGAGHFVAADKPREMFAYVRDVVVAV